MNIYYETDTVQALVSACESANDQISKANQLINQIRSHDDWTCREKNDIDDMMEQVTRITKKLMESESGFLAVIRTVGEQLLNAESGIGKLFSSVDDILRRILAVPVSQVVVHGGGLLTNGMQSGSQPGWYSGDSGSGVGAWASTFPYFKSVDGTQQ